MDFRAHRVPVLRPSRHLLVWLATSVFAALFVAACASWVMARIDSALPSGRPTLQAHFTVCNGGGANCVIDGDTIRVDGVKIRLSDIDAPEVFSPSCPSEKSLGDRTTARLLALLNQGPFSLVRTGPDQDRYGRKLRQVERNGVSLGDVLVAEGLARQWDGARHSWCV